MGGGGLLYSYHISLSILNQLPLWRNFAYDSSLLGILDTIVGTYKCPLALRSFMFFFLHFMPFLFHSSFLSFCGGPSFSLPPGQWKEGLDPTVTGFLQPWGLGRCIHPDHSQQQMEWPKGKEREVEITHFCTKLHTFNQPSLFSLGPRGSVGVAGRCHRTEINTQFFHLHTMSP